MTLGSVNHLGEATLLVGVFVALWLLADWRMRIWDSDPDAPARQAGADPKALTRRRRVLLSGFLGPPVAAAILWPFVGGVAAVVVMLILWLAGWLGIVVWLRRSETA